MVRVHELIDAASALSVSDRAELVASLLEELDPHPHLVSDEEALKRRDALLSGEVAELSEEEFWKACGRTR